MKRTALSIVMVGAALSVAVLAQAPTAPATPDAPATPGAGQVPAVKHDAGYTTLFNRKDLTGWKVGGPESDFKVVDGAIQANGVDGPGHVFYEGDFHNHTFRNFDLKLDVMAKHRSNGGVYVLTELQDKGFPGKGFEIQVNDSHSDRIRTGSLYHVVDLSNIPGKDDEWIPMQITAQGNTIAISVKGQEVVRWTQPADWQSNYDTASRKIAPGTIAFQSHDAYSVTAYSNNRIKVAK
jgi:hypothetical protein